jgi:hypothetical protein
MFIGRNLRPYAPRSDCRVSPMLIRLEAAEGSMRPISWNGHIYLSSGGRIDRRQCSLLR